MSEGISDFLTCALLTQRGAKPNQIISSKVKHKVVLLENTEGNGKAGAKKRKVR